MNLFKNVLFEKIGLNQFSRLPTGLAILGLAACSTPNMSSPGQDAAAEKWPLSSAEQAFQAEGRLAVKLEGKGSYANFDWNNNQQVQTIEVNTPIGSTVGTLCRDAQGVIAVNQRGETFKADDAEALSKQLLGFAIPLQYLPIWVEGKRVDAPYQVLPDGSLQQFGWHIIRTSKTDGSPKMLQLSGKQLNIKLLFDKFEAKQDQGDRLKQCEARQ